MDPVTRFTSMMEHDRRSGRATDLWLPDGFEIVCHTGVSAAWCPICGDCTCGEHDLREFGKTYKNCPLHGTESEHEDGLTQDGIDRPDNVPTYNCTCVGVPRLTGDHTLIRSFIPKLHCEAHGAHFRALNQDRILIGHGFHGLRSDFIYGGDIHEGQCGAWIMQHMTNRVLACVNESGHTGRHQSKRGDQWEHIDGKACSAKKEGMTCILPRNHGGPYHKCPTFSGAHEFQAKEFVSQQWPRCQTYLPCMREDGHGEVCNPAPSGALLPQRS